jgi:hypothetical protein
VPRVKTLLRSLLLSVALLVASCMACPWLAAGSGYRSVALVSVERSCAAPFSIVIRNYLKPLNQLPPIPEPSVSGKMPFAHRGMSLGVAGDRLVVGGGEVGFFLSDIAVHRVRHLNWIVETDLARVNRKGDAISRFGVKRRRVLSIEVDRIRPFLRHVPDSPGYYRVDIRFLRRGTGRLLGAYSTYVRAVKARAKLRMKLETPIVAPGEYARAYLLNLGTTPIAFRSRRSMFAVQTLTEDGWSTVPPNPSLLELKLLRRPYVLPAGPKTPICYLVPQDQPSGRFRFSTLWRINEHTFPLDAEFEVRAPHKPSPTYTPGP